MNKSRWSNYGLWVALFSLLALVCKGYGIEILPSNYDQIVSTLLTALVAAGIVSNPITDNKGFLDDKDQK